MKAGKKNVPFMATRGERIFYKINNVVMLVLIAITVYPMLYVVFCSFSNPDEYAFQMGRLLLRPAGGEFRFQCRIFLHQLKAVAVGIQRGYL